MLPSSRGYQPVSLSAESHLLTEKDKQDLDHVPAIDEALQPSSFSRHSFLSSWRVRVNSLLAVLLFAYTVLCTAVVWRAYMKGSFEPELKMPMHGCGNSTDEARKLGCKFDIVTNHWTPQECWDEATANDFREWLGRGDRSAGAWPFYEDLMGTKQVPDEAALSERVFMQTFSTKEHHQAHCVFVMQRLRRALDTKDRLLSAPSMLHVEHCQTAIFYGMRDISVYEEKNYTSGPLGATFQVRFGTCHDI